MSDCQHLIVTRWIESETGKPVDLWACEDCRRRFAPIHAPIHAPRSDFSDGILDKEITKKLIKKEVK